MLAHVSGIPIEEALNQRVVTILDSGKSVVISQASDPSSDRKMPPEESGASMLA